MSRMPERSAPLEGMGTEPRGVRGSAPRKAGEQHHTGGSGGIGAVGGGVAAPDQSGAVDQGSQVSGRAVRPSSESEGEGSMQHGSSSSEVQWRVPRGDVPAADVEGDESEEDDSGGSGSDGDGSEGEDSESDGVLAEDREQRWLIQNERERVRARRAWFRRLTELEEMLQELLLADEITWTREWRGVQPLLSPMMAELKRMRSEAVGFFRGFPEDAVEVINMLDGGGKVRELMMRVVDRIELELMQGVTGTPDCYEEECMEEDQEQEEGGSSEGEGEDQEQEEGGSSEGEGEGQDWWVEARESESEFYTDRESESDCWKDPPVMEMSTMQLPATLVAGAEVVELSQGVVEETTPAQPRGPSCSVASPPVRCDIDPSQPRGPSCPVASPPVLCDGVPSKPRGPSRPVVPIHLAPRDAPISQSGDPSHPVTPTSAPLHDMVPPPSSSLSCPAASPPFSPLPPLL